MDHSSACFALPSKKLSRALLVALLVAVLVGCDKETDEDESQSADTDSSPTANEEAAKTGESEDSDPTSKESADSQTEGAPSKSAARYLNACDQVHRAQADAQVDSSLEAAAYKHGCLWSAQNRQFSSMVKREESGDASLEITVVDRSEDDSRDRNSHEFDNLGSFLACLELGYGDSLDDPKPVNEEHCDAPDEMRSQLLGHRTGMYTRVEECADGCCTFAKGPPVDEGLKLRKMCFEKSGDEEYRPVEATIERTDPVSDSPLVRRREAALEFGWAYNEHKREQLADLLEDEGDIQLELKITSAVDDDSTHDLDVSEGGELIACLEGNDDCQFPENVASKLSGPEHHAYLGIEECSETCCKFAEGNAIHNTLFLDEVCFNTETKRPKIDNLRLRWQW
ncbi:MAG: hypothetical protein ACOCV2_05515 [Persicimonas sp.]